jgi:hypothetical protein
MTNMGDCSQWLEVSRDISAETPIQQHYNAATDRLSIIRSLSTEKSVLAQFLIDSGWGTLPL